MQRLSLLSGDRPRSVYRRVDAMDFILLGDRRQAHYLPVALPQHVPHHIVQVQALHDHDHGAGLLVVESAHDGVVQPVVGALAQSVGDGLVRLEWIVDQDDVAAQAGEHATHRGGKAPSSGQGTQVIRRRPGTC